MNQLQAELQALQDLYMNLVQNRDAGKKMGILTPQKSQQISIEMERIDKQIENITHRIGQSA